MPEKNNSLVNLITLRMQHHARSSGYDRLCDYIDANVISSVENWTLDKRILTRLLRFAEKRSCLQWYHRDSLYSEIRAARQWLKGSGQIFHYLYGENSYRYLGGMKFLGSKNSIVCSYHTPPEKFDAVVRSRNHLRYVDAVVVVSTMQQEYFSSIVGSERVFYVPHGIDVDYYRPERSKIRAEPESETRCLFVGSHLRDIETLAAAARKLEKISKKVTFDIVTKEVNWESFSDCKNVKLLSGVGNDVLLDLYQSSDIFVMPLLECTANNGLLEALACGMPIVSTDLQGVRDYVDKDCALLAPKSDVNRLVDIIESLAGNREERRLMSEASRNRSLAFRWEKVANEMKGLYRTLL